MAGPPNNIPLRAKWYLESGIGLVTTLTQCVPNPIPYPNTNAYPNPNPYLTLTRTLILTRTLNRALTLPIPPL